MKMINLCTQYSFNNDLWIVELAILLFTILIVINKNPIYSVLFLIAVFTLIAIELTIIDVIYIGLSYILVYVGAISIIFLFILMLIDIRISELHNDSNNYIFLSIFISYVYFNLFFNFNLNNIFINSEIKYSIANLWDGTLIENYDIISIGNILYTNLSILLILSLLILLLAMIGSIKINLVPTLKK